jgi:hypothetical protein
MAHPDSDSDGPNPSKSFSIGAADRLSGFFTPVWESKRRRSDEGERSPSSRPPARALESTPPSSAAEANETGSRKSQPPSPRIPMPERRPSAPPPPPAKVVVQPQDLADDERESVELPPEAFIDAEPALKSSKPEKAGKAGARGRARKHEPVAVKASTPAKAAEIPRPAVVAAPREAELARARRSSIPPAPAAEPAKRWSSIPPAPAADARKRPSSIPPAPAADALRRPSSVPPAPAADALGRRPSRVPPAPTLGQAALHQASVAPKPAVPRPGSTPPAARPLERRDAAAVNTLVVHGATEAEAHGATHTANDARPSEPAKLVEKEPRDNFAETLLGVSAAEPEPQRAAASRPAAPAQRTVAYASPSYAGESRALMTSGPLGTREVHSSEWDSPDTLPRPLATASEVPTPEMRTAHLLRRLRRTIPLYAPLPESIRSMIDRDQSQQ